jgi:hypothetical protein
VLAGQKSTVEESVLVAVGAVVCRARVSSSVHVIIHSWLVGCLVKMNCYRLCLNISNTRRDKSGEVAGFWWSGKVRRIPVNRSKDAKQILKPVLGDF